MYANQFRRSNTNCGDFVRNLLVSKLRIEYSMRKSTKSHDGLKVHYCECDCFSFSSKSKEKHIVIAFIFPNKFHIVYSHVISTGTRRNLTPTLSLRRTSMSVAVLLTHTPPFPPERALNTDIFRHLQYEQHDHDRIPGTVWCAFYPPTKHVLLITCILLTRHVFREVHI